MGAVLDLEIPSGNSQLNGRNGHACTAICAMCLVTQLCPTLWDLVDCSPPGSSVHGDSPGKNTWVGCHFLLQRIFPTQGSNPGLPHCRWILCQVSHQGSPCTTILCDKWYIRIVSDMCVHVGHSVMSNSCDPVKCSPPGTSVHGILQARILGSWVFLNSRVGCRFLLQRIFPNQESIPGPLHCRQVLYHLRHQGSPVRCTSDLNAKDDLSDVRVLQLSSEALFSGG